MAPLYQGFGLRAELGLSQMHQKKLERIWNERVSDPLAFVPGNLRESIEPTVALDENKKFGEFAVGFLREVLRLTSRAGGDESETSFRQAGTRKLLAVGYGRKYDSNWLADAYRAGFETWWLDVSSVACRWATEDMKEQYAAATKTTQFPLICLPKIKQGEIRTVLAEPESIGLEPHTVELWYLCRVLNCLSVRSACIVLRQIGHYSFSENQDPSKQKGLVLVTTLRDCNKEVVGYTSRLHTRRKVLSNLRKGAGREVEVKLEASYRYFNQIVSALYIQAA